MKYSLNDLKKFKLLNVPKREARIFIRKYHYSGYTMPRLTKIILGWYNKNDELIAVITLGWGTRPLHTIKKLFNNCTTKDYYEIGKMCLHEDLQKNSETIFLSQVTKYLKKNCPDLLFLFTWSDGIFGKAGYVYQAFNMLYGGYIITDVYSDNNGKRYHPRTISGIIKKKYGLKKGNALGSRPDFKQRKDLKLNRIKGKQFKYILPLNKKSKKLIKLSNTNWNVNYPKDKDLSWYLLEHREKKYKKIFSCPLYIGEYQNDFKDLPLFN